MKIPLWLDHAVRELVQEEKGPFFIATPFPTKLDEIATEVMRAAPDDLARLGFAVAHEIDSDALPVTDFSGEFNDLPGRIAAALRSAKNPLIVSGVSCRTAAILEAAAQVAWALCKAGKPAKLSFCFPECNSAGLGLMNPRPLSEAFEAVRDGRAETVIILENDLYRRAPSEEVTLFLGSAQHVIALDHLKNRTTDRAELVLPAGTFAETDGTLVNHEIRAQRFFQAFVPSGEVRASWRWLDSGHKWWILDDIVSAISKEIAALAPIEHAAPSRNGLGKVAREPSRYSGRTSMLANITVHEPKPPEDPDSALAFSMESGPQAPPPALIPFFWSPGWNSIQSVNKFQAEIGGHLRGGDPGVRLIEPGQQDGWSYFSRAPSAFQPGAGEWLILPRFHIFGSEELSRHSPAIAQLVPRVLIGLNAIDGALLGVKDGELIKITTGNSAYEMEVALQPDLPRGIAVVPADVSLPAHGKLEPLRATVYGVATK
ncbi:MAG: molybdopterin-dependent oxidoreductase, partial [Acidobacteriaceae bacterium]|nr:molybdopterin-dependent oxidoreductase [Acidobacteriaceae bacterium]